MTTVPDEIWTDILDYLDPLDLISFQQVSRRLFKLARDTSLWRNKVFERAPSAAHARAISPTALSDLTGALGGLSLGEPHQLANQNITDNLPTSPSHNRASRRVQAVRQWDKTHKSEKIDWYSEYVARHAPLSTIWAESKSPLPEVRGMALLAQTEKVISSLEDGSLAIWDVRRASNGRRQPTQIMKSRSGILFQDMYSLGEPAFSTKSKTLGTAIESIHVDSKRLRAFVAVQNILNEVDLERMEIISQNKFAWPITALSQEGCTQSDLTVGTSFSLHVYDPRIPFLRPSDNAERLDSSEYSKIAFLQNWAKHVDVQFPGMPHALHDGTGDSCIATNRLEAFARVEPGPQSILHLGKHDIVIAGRMPSILFYDRRNFPKPHTAIHSGARLSAMTVLPVPPAEAGSHIVGDSTLIACGEYGGRGSLEIYELPRNHSTSPKPVGDHAEPNVTSNTSQTAFSFKNRQEASSSKLLSVATQGTRIVFSDSEGMLKWVERDGRGLARRWNINAFQMNERGASVSGDKVVRKIVPLSEPRQSTERGSRGDNDLLIWTGEKIGIVNTKPKAWTDHDELVRAFERGMDLNDNTNDATSREIEYSTMMRRALERQADERRWMSRFGMRRW